MNKTTVFALVGAFFTAFIVAVLISATVSGKKDQGVKDAPSEAVQILLAAKDLPIGSTLAENNVYWQDWPKDKIIPNAIVKGKEGSDKTIGKKLRRPLLKDEPVTSSALFADASGGYLAAALEPGMRAVSIKTGPTSGVAGFVTPGDRVDVILVYALKIQTDNPKEQQKTVVKYTSETILSDIRVLAVDQRSDSTDTSKITVGKTATLEVTPEQAEKIATAESMGNLQLSLRKLGDTAKTETKGTADIAVSKTLQKAVDMSEGNGGTGKGTIRVYSQSGVNDISVRGAKTPEDNEESAQEGAGPEEDQ